MDVVALGELLIDFTCIGSDDDGYPTMAAHPGGAPANYLAAPGKIRRPHRAAGQGGGRRLRPPAGLHLRKAGVETKGVVCADDVFTTLAFVTLDQTATGSFPLPASPARIPALPLRSWISRSSTEQRCSTLAACPSPASPPAPHPTGGGIRKKAGQTHQL